jgi:hypothetical protein
MPNSSARSRFYQTANRLEAPRRLKFSLFRDGRARALAVLGTLLLAGHAASAGPRDTTTAGPWQFDLSVLNGQYYRNVPRVLPALGPVIRPPPSFNNQAAFKPFSQGDNAVPSAVARVSMIAMRNGDRNFLMVDKAHGKLFLFENGRLILSRAALTGESMADQFPPDAWTKTWAQQRNVRYKVTPAGRFTLTRNHDRGLGDIFDINELRGRDWIIAIHKAWLGRNYEHRDARLRSDVDLDKHITDGCVDVDPETLTQLLRLLPSQGMPVYILPVDDNLIPALFQARGFSNRGLSPES